MRKRTKWLIGVGVVVLAAVVGLFIAASVLSRRFEPYIREQAIAYLNRRFDADVEIAALRVRVPKTSPFRLMVTRGRGIVAGVEADGIVLRQKGRPGDLPVLRMRRFAFEADLGSLADETKRITLVTVDDAEIAVPPKGERPGFGSSQEPAGQTSAPASVSIDEVLLRKATLILLPKEKAKVPLRFDIAQLRLRSAGPGTPMRYEATLRNPKPPGDIRSTGTFGPWVAREPGDTPLAGEYTFDKADLGVFSGIAGILRSTGSFAGSLSAVNARGEATVPDFRLKMAGNPVPLSTRFEVLVDGTNGNTVLKPVVARLGSTGFTTSGAVIKHDGDPRRTITLDVSMPKGNLRDLLRLAMKGQPFMEGQIAMTTKIAIPPLSGKVREKLQLDGRFRVASGKFLRSTIQDQLDMLSRRGQGQPQNEEIDEVVSAMGGSFRMANEVLSFSKLAFDVPGAAIALAGNYDLGQDLLDFHGTLRLRARVSQTMTGWKRWALKPVDPFFAKQGAGTLLRIKVVGPARKPSFGLDRGKSGS